MVIKVFLSGISASKEVKKRQQRALIILDSCKVDYESIDITEPGMEQERTFMHEKSKVRSPNKTPVAPQFFNEDDYCGDYEDFDSAVEVNQVLQFLKLEAAEENGTTNGIDHIQKEEEVTNGTTQAEVNEQEAEAEVDKEAAEEDDEGKALDEDSRDVVEENEDEGLWGDDAQDDSSKKRKELGDSDLSESSISIHIGEDSPESRKRLKVQGEDGEGEEDDDDDFWGEHKSPAKKVDDEEEEEEEEEDAAE